MSHSTDSVFVTYSKGWASLLSHPAMQWMEKYTKAFDNKEIYDTPYTEWHTSDYTYTRSTGESESGEAAWSAMMKTYAPFKAHLHEPKWACIQEIEGGWEMVGQATLFVDLSVEGGEKMAEDLDGRKWDLGVPGMFRFVYFKDAEAQHGGIKMKSSQIFSDTAPVVLEMLKRGMMKPEQLAG